MFLSSFLSFLSFSLPALFALGCAKRAQDQAGFPPLPLVSAHRIHSVHYGVVPWSSQYIWYSSSEICTVNHLYSSYRIHGKWMPISKGVFSLRRSKQFPPIKTVLQVRNNINWISGKTLFYIYKWIRVRTRACVELRPSSGFRELFFWKKAVRGNALSRSTFQ